MLESRKFKLLVKTKATGTPLRGVIIVPICMVGYGIYIGVGLSALLGSTSRAMREPQHVDRASGLAPRFCLYAKPKTNGQVSGVCLDMNDKNDKWILHLK